MAGITLKTHCRYPAVVYLEAGTYGVAFPDFEGVISAGDSLGEAMDNAVEALQLTLDVLVEEHAELPSSESESWEHRCSKRSTRRRKPGKKICRSRRF